METHYQPFNYATTTYQDIAATIIPNNPNKVVETVAFAFVYQYNENVMTLKNAMLNICDIAFDFTATNDDNNNTTTNPDNESEEITYPYDGSVSTYDLYGNALTTKQDSVIKDSSDKEVIDTSKPFISTSSKYDSTGNYVKSETDAKGNTVSYEVKSSNGNVTKVTDGKGNETNYAYDSAGNITSVSSGGSSNTYTYNSANQLSAISHNGFSYKFNYDVYNKFVSATIGDTAIVTNTYDDYNGNLIKTKYGNDRGQIYSYDEYDRITDIFSIVEGPLVRYTYNKKGLITKAVTVPDHGSKDIAIGTLKSIMKQAGLL